MVQPRRMINLTRPNNIKEFGSITVDYIENSAASEFCMHRTVWIAHKKILKRETLITLRIYIYIYIYIYTYIYVFTYTYVTYRYICMCQHIRAKLPYERLKLLSIEWRTSFHETLKKSRRMIEAFEISITLKSERMQNIIEDSRHLNLKIRKPERSRRFIVTSRNTIPETYRLEFFSCHISPFVFYRVITFGCTNEFWKARTCIFVHTHIYICICIYIYIYIYIHTRVYATECYICRKAISFTCVHARTHTHIRAYVHRTHRIYVSYVCMHCVHVYARMYI